MRWIVTGSSGFLGRAVTARLAERQGDAVIGIRRRVRGNDQEIAADLSTISVDALAHLIENVAPDALIHCAGRTPPARPVDYWSENTRSTANLVAACAQISADIPVVLVGSAAELGPVPADRLPVSEACPCRPRDSYGLSKWAATVAGLGGPRAGRSAVVVGRVFNLIGPGMPATQAFGRFARELAGAPCDPVTIAASDLDARRDFLDVRDAAGALIALAEHGRAGEVYHVATGVSHSIGDGLGVLICSSGRAVHVAPATRAATGAFESRASIDKIVQETGWRPVISFEQSLDDTWRSAFAFAENSKTSRSVA